MFGLFVSVADSNGIGAAVLLFIFLGVAGVWAIVQFILDHSVAVLIGGSVLGMYVFNWVRRLVDKRI